MSRSWTPESWKQLEGIVQDALDQPASQRSTFLAEICDGDATLIDEARSLLESCQASEDFLEPPSPSPDTIGPYRLVRPLGSGGMGTVYLAERQNEFRQQVALKILHPGSHGETFRARFRGERQILAQLDHPNIARLFAGGTTLDGRPYFAMELVDGMPIDEYCDHHRLRIRQRLELFAEACEAVLYAHRNLVVHRDLKPSNLFVTQRGVPKLLDFGIAKLLDSEAFPFTAEPTRTGQVPMTPRYASPEQQRGEVVSTATDVYSLGMILYRLLCGWMPFPASLSPTEILEAKQRGEIPAPSETISPRAGGRNGDSSGSHDEIAARRGTTAAGLRRQLRGDLDNIVAMALRPEPERRYGSVEPFLEDLRRHLHQMPVRARAETLGYRTGRFLRRHRLEATFASLVFGLLLTFSVVVSGQRDQARLERDKAEQVTRFLVDLFEVADPSVARGETITAREVLDRGARRLDRELHDRPLVRAELLDAIGLVYHNLGLYQPAAEHLRDALETRRELLGGEHLEVAESLSHLGAVQVVRGEHDLAQGSLRRALEVQSRKLGGDHPAMLSGLNTLAASFTDNGEYEDAAELLQRAIGISRSMPNPDHEEWITSLVNLGWIDQYRGDLDRSESHLSEARALAEQHLEPDDLLLADAKAGLASLYHDQGRWDLAEDHYRSAIELTEKLLGPEHHDVAITLNNLAVLYNDQGIYGETLPLYERILDISRQNLGPEHESIGSFLENLGRAQQWHGQLQRAEESYRRALEIRRKAFGDLHPGVAHSYQSLGDICWLQGRLEEADRHFRQAFDGYIETLGGEHHLIAEIYRRQALLARERGDNDTAISLLARALPIKEASRGPKHPDTLHLHNQLARGYRLSRDTAAAERHAHLALDLAEELLAQRPGAARLLYEKTRALSLLADLAESRAVATDRRKRALVAFDPVIAKSDSIRDLELYLELLVGLERWDDAEPVAEHLWRVGWRVGALLQHRQEIRHHLSIHSPDGSSSGLQASL